MDHLAQPAELVQTLNVIGKETTALIGCPAGIQPAMPIQSASTSRNMAMERSRHLRSTGGRRVVVFAAWLSDCDVLAPDGMGCFTLTGTYRVAQGWIA